MKKTESGHGDFRSSDFVQVGILRWNRLNGTRKELFKPLYDENVYEEYKTRREWTYRSRKRKNTNGRCLERKKKKKKKEKKMENLGKH